MLKKVISVLLVTALSFSLAACKSGGGTAHEKIQKRLTDMKSYECTATIKRISNKGENTYGVKQWHKMTGEYRMDMISPENVAGNYTIYDGKKVCQYNPKMNSAVAVEVEANQARNELFMGQFVKNYLKSEEVALVVEELDDGRYTVLEAVIPGNYQHMATEKLWIDNETQMPVKLVIYDADGKERFVVNYEEFSYDPEIDPKMFEITQ